jgi:16S rRNA (guanine966-N2)-methyltransferase
MQGWVRIIAGKWRGRRLPVLTLENLRPTPDRVRETLFNWLTPMLPKAHCLDLFAGTGALGFEALSRGAEKVVMVDNAPQVVKQLKMIAQSLDAENIQIYCADLPQQLQPTAIPFNIVFLDPPYQENLLLPTCAFLEKNGYLADIAYIYLEASHLILDNELPLGWQIYKSQKAGQVFYHLAKRELMKS